MYSLRSLNVLERKIAKIWQNAHKVKLTENKFAVKKYV